MPVIPIRRSETIIHDRSTKRRVRSAIPLSRTSMKVDDLLTISTTNIKHLNISQHKMVSLHKGLHRVRLQREEKEVAQRQQKDESGQSVSMPTVTEIKVVLNPPQSQQRELPALPEDDNKNFNTSKQSVIKSNSKLSPLTGVYSTLPIGTLSGTSFNLTCKNNGIKSS